MSLMIIYKYSIKPTHGYSDSERNEIISFVIQYGLTIDKQSTNSEWHTQTT